MEQSESLSPAEESTSVMEDINRWDLVWWTRDQGVGGALAAEGRAHARLGRGRCVLGQGGREEAGLGFRLYTM